MTQSTKPITLLNQSMEAALAHAHDYKHGVLVPELSQLIDSIETDADGCTVLKPRPVRHPTMDRTGYETWSNKVHLSTILNLPATDNQLLRQALLYQDRIAEHLKQSGKLFSICLSLCIDHDDPELSSLTVGFCTRRSNEPEGYSLEVEMYSLEAIRILYSADNEPRS
jgi:hypothetical protein